MVIKHPDGRLIAIEIKRSSAPILRAGFYEVCKDIQPTHCYVVYDGDETFSMGHGVYAIGLQSLMKEMD